MGVKDHPLFDPPADGKSRDIHFIVVQRMQSGTWITSPTPHTHDDFPSLQALQAIYGGGKYRLMARDAANAKITARKDWDLPGAPLPFPGEAAPPAAASAPATPPGLDPMLAFIVQQSSKSEERTIQMMQMMMQMQAQAAQQIASIMASQAQASAQSNQQVMGLLAALLQRPQPDPSAALTTGLQMGMQLMREAATPEGGGGGEGGDLLDQIAGPVIAGMGQAIAEDMARPKAGPPAASEGPASAAGAAPSADGDDKG